MTGIIKILLLGFAKVELPSGMVISDVTILTSERGPLGIAAWQADARPRRRSAEGCHRQVTLLAEQGHPDPLVRRGNFRDARSLSRGVQQ